MQIVNTEVSSSNFTFQAPMPGNTNLARIVLSHWLGGTLDMDLEVSYDGGGSWEYGGGCKGAVSAEPSIEFHFTYRSNPTHIKGVFTSEDLVNSNLQVYAGD